MWILPRQLHTSAYVPDTAALSLDCTELSEICARSLFARSKPSPARTWSQKWKRDSWTRHLSGRILNPSHGQSFVTAWTSSLGAIPASHSAQPESASAQTTLATSGHLSQTEFDFFNPAFASSKMSKATSPSDSEKSLESWNQSVIKRRGEYSARLKSAHRTSASGSSSWPTIRASEYKDTGPIGSKSHDHMLGKGYLCAVVTQDAANWPTPDTSNHRDGVVLRKDNNLEQGGFHGVSLHHAMTKYGQAAPANPSTDGSRQGLWPTARSLDGMVSESLGTWEARRIRKAAEGINLHRPLPIAVMQEQFPTPRACDWKSSPDADSNIKRMASGQATLGEFVHAKEKQWRTPSVAEEKNQNTSTQIYLQNQVGATPKAWATPQLQDGHNINQDSTTHKTIPAQLTKMNMAGKLNPRWVETLMGLPVGWVMPSCASPVTIEPTNCDSSATESCQQQQSELFAF